jgi:hypothetical protein
VIIFTYSEFFLFLNDTINKLSLVMHAITDPKKEQKKIHDETTSAEFPFQDFRGGSCRRVTACLHDPKIHQQQLLARPR